MSLVGFQFLDTRVLGIGWPGFRNFPEWNLRFYRPTRMASAALVSFASSYHRGLLQLQARVLYNEPYRSAHVDGCDGFGRFHIRNLHGEVAGEGAFTPSNRRQASHAAEDQTVPNGGSRNISGASVHRKAAN